MPLQPNGRFLLSTPAEWAAIRSPTAMELLEVVAAIGPATVADIAAAMGRRPTGLYHHLQRFERLGMIRATVDDGTASARRTTRYGPAASSWALDFDPRTGRNIERLQAVHRTAFRRTLRMLDDALLAGLLPADRRDPPWATMIDIAWLTKSEIDELSRLAKAINDIYAGARGRRHGRRWVTLLSTFPGAASSAAPSPAHRERGTRESRRRGDAGRSSRRPDPGK